MVCARPPNPSFLCSLSSHLLTLPLRTLYLPLPTLSHLFPYFIIIMCLGWVYVNEVPAKAKSSGHELPAVGWAQDSGPLQEQKALLTTELLSRPRIEIFRNEKKNIIFVFTHICAYIYIR